MKATAISLYMPAVSLMALRELAPQAFYGQTWYVQEPFARKAVEAGRYVLGAEAPAVVWAYAYLQARNRGEEFQAFSWTGETDREGRPIYVQSGSQGFEVHRQLTHLPEVSS